jgi:hypothetical protein
MRSKSNFCPIRTPINNKLIYIGITKAKQWIKDRLQGANAVSPVNQTLRTDIYSKGIPETFSLDTGATLKSPAHPHLIIIIELYWLNNYLERVERAG